MNDTTIKVLERFVYENLLLASGIMPRKRRITLGEVLDAGQKEPRILTVLPAILIYNPKIILKIHKDLAKFPQAKQIADLLFANEAKDFWGIPIAECRKAALTYKAYLDHKRKKNRTRLFNLRLSEKDMERLEYLSEKLGTFNHSETIRQLLYQM